jgi:type I site-specific restriction-modification system R (restriction) subunit
MTSCTTIQKFFPEEKGDRHPVLSGRRTIVVIADEAHRSQYDFIDGFARYMRDALPNASFIAFTGTPLELDDRNTRLVFGDYISIYEEALRIRDDVAFFQAVRAALAKRAPGEAKTEEELDQAIRQIVSRAVAPEGVVDLFAAAGLKKPDISILSDEFLAEGGACHTATWRWSCCGSSSPARSGRAGGRTWSRPGPSPRCWSRPFAVTRAAPRRQRR